MDANHIHEDVPGGVPLKMWTRGVPVEDEAKRQLTNAARLPIVFKHIAAMPDLHFGIGATVGCVIPTFKANFVGTMFIERARQDAMRHQADLPDRGLAYFEEGSRCFSDCARAVGWAQKFAAINREVMMKCVIEAARTVLRKSFNSHIEAVNCHHKPVSKEHHFGEEVVRHPQGRDQREGRSAGHHPRQHGRAQLHRARQEHPEPQALEVERWRDEAAAVPGCRPR